MNPVKSEISVVIPAYNEENRIGLCIQALQHQTFQLPYEIIVSDNNSTDRTKKIARTLSVRVIDELIKGCTYALRQGVQTARSDIIAITDADCRPPPDWLDRIYQHFNHSSDVMAVGGPFVFYDGPTWVQKAVRLCNTLHSHLLTASLCGMNMAFRRYAYERVGGFNTAVNLQSDTQLGYRLMNEGKVIFDPKLIMRASARRYHSPVQVIRESFRRVTNVIALRFIGKPIMYEFSDVRD